MKLEVVPSMRGIPHAYLTAELPGAGGRIKEDFDDFRVEEVPLYSASGEGEHVFFEVEKTDLSTIEAIERLSHELDRDFADFGFAGLKDRKGITRQVFSIAGFPPERLLRLGIPQLQVLWARRHANKLRVGHLRGNRFVVRVRGVEESMRRDVETVLSVIMERGLPNYYGHQRFGTRGDAQWVGRALLRHDDEAAIRRILGHPSTAERNPDIVAARYLFMQYRWTEALERFPRAYREEHKLLRYLLRSGENFTAARRRIRLDIVRLYFTAYQSYLFNKALETRLILTEGDLERFFPGDVAYNHRNGSLFRVEEPSAVLERTRSFEISPSGPIFGKKMLIPAPGIQEEIESRLLEEHGLLHSDFFELQQRFRLGGGRRPFRVKVKDLEWHFEENSLILKFFLPKGSYATTLLREVMKNEEVPPGFSGDGAT